MVFINTIPIINPINDATNIFFLMMFFANIIKKYQLQPPSPSPPWAIHQGQALPEGVPVPAKG